MTVATASPASAAPKLQPPLLAVRVAPGHEEDEALLKRTDLPAAGWVKRIYREGGKLKADFSEVPEVIEQLVNRRAYRKISAEIYTEFADQGEQYGLVLRRVVLLGGEIPQVKSLADIPAVANGEVNGVEIFAEGTHRGRLWTRDDLDQICRNFERLSIGQANYSESATYKSILVFHEVQPMSKRLKATAAELRARAARFSQKARATLKKFADEPPADPAAPPADAAPPEDVTPEGMVALLTEWGWDAAVLEKVKDEDALAEMVRMTRMMMDAAPKPPDKPADQPPEPKPGEQMSATPPIQSMPQPQPSAPSITPPSTPQQVTFKYGEEIITLDAAFFQPMIAAALKPIQDQVGAAAQNVEKFTEAEKRRSIDSRLDVMLKQGKVLPAEMDAGLRDRLYRANGVAKFSDGRTELDCQFGELEARPCLVKFSEVVKTGKGGAGSADDETAKVQRFAEEDQPFAHALKASGKTATDYVGNFRKAKEKNPNLTARAYGVPEPYLN